MSITDERGKFLGTALYSSSSQIAIRMISSHAVDDLARLLRDRIRRAISYRERVVRETDAYRVIFSEADFLPGLIVDRYNDLLSIQALTQAMDAEPVRSVIVAELSQRLKPEAIAERVDPRIRELEQLPARPSGLIHREKSSTIVTMNGVRFHYAALEGQKTGSFLDQRENYAAAAHFAHGEALDVFCYQGGFALHLARSCSKVAGVDSSRPALEVADRNATLNSREIEWIEANAFDLLRDYADAGRRYDTIVLDPPAFAKSKSNLRDRPPRIQRAQPACAQDVAAGRHPDLLLLLLSRQPSPIPGGRRRVGPRCPQKPADHRNPRPSQGPPRPDKCAGNRILEVCDMLRK